MFHVNDVDFDFVDVTKVYVVKHVPTNKIINLSKRYGQFLSIGAATNAIRQYIKRKIFWHSVRNKTETFPRQYAQDHYMRITQELFDNNILTIEEVEC